MASSHFRPFLGGDEEPKYTVFDGYNRDNNNGMKNFENWSKTDGGMIKITNADNNDNNNSTRSTSGNNRMKRINNLTPSRRHSKKNKKKMNIRKKQKDHL